MEKFYIEAWNVRRPKPRTYGPFTDIQITYDCLRVCGLDGVDIDEFAVYDPVCQENDPTKWSDSPDGWVFFDGYIASDFSISHV